MTTFQLGITSADAITFYPEWDYTGGEKKIQDKHRAASGKAFQYTWGSYKRFKCKLNWVTNSDSSLVNSWWDTDTELLLFITSDSTTEVHSVMLSNDETPFSKFNEPYDNLYQGTIELESY